MAVNRYAPIIIYVALGLAFLIVLLVLAGKFGELKITTCDIGSPFDCIGKLLEGLKPK